MKKLASNPYPVRTPGYARSLASLPYDLFGAGFVSRDDTRLLNQGNLRSYRLLWKLDQEKSNLQSHHNLRNWDKDFQPNLY
ncbi:transposase [Corchorus olitorius]|uniref:Transposase n=1 Tax=Corchorus olitorius TaxID=93759 RepID=A0A1R3L0N4_9ROSI|nr:transposase [Corchorus olitorius]